MHKHTHTHTHTHASCCMRRDSARVLSAANTDASSHRHKTRMHHPVTLPRHRANQSWFYPLNAERLARKQPVPIVTPLVCRGRGSNSRPTDYEANALSTRPPSRSRNAKKQFYEFNWNLVWFVCVTINHPSLNPAAGAERWDRLLRSQTKVFKSVIGWLLAKRSALRG